MLVFICICLEIFGRIYLTKILQKSTDQKFRFNSYRLYEHVPGFKEGDGKRNWIEINGQGFRRSTETSLAKPKNTYRIFLLGGSAGHGISSAPPYPVVHVYQNETIDFYLEKYLKQKYPTVNFEVINAAVTGYRTHQHTSYILSELLDYDPDLFVFYDGANDHYINNPLHNQYMDNEYQFWRSRLQKPSIGGYFDYFMLWISKCSGFARGYMAWKMQRDAGAHNGMQFMTRTHTSEISNIVSHKFAAKKNFLRSIESNISILKNNGIPSIISLQPMLVLRDENLLSDEEKKWLHKDPSLKLLYPYVVNELQDLCKKYNTCFVNLVPAFNDQTDRSKQLFIDYCHLNARGGEVVAKKLFLSVDSIYVNSLKK
jgi:hypothetical protein